MTDQTSEVTDGVSAGPDADESQPSIFDQPEGTDWLLAWLLTYAENHGVEFQVTLHVRGLIITGVLISGHAYLTEMAKQFRGLIHGDPPEGQLSIHALVADSLDQYKSIYRDPASEGPFELAQPGYMHLRRSRIIHDNGTMIPSGGALWRGKLSSVDGFTIGELSVSRS